MDYPEGLPTDNNYGDKEHVLSRGLRRLLSRSRDICSDWIVLWLHRWKTEDNQRVPHGRQEDEFLPRSAVSAGQLHVR